MLLNSRRTIGTIAHMMLGLRGAEEFHWAWTQMVEFNADYLVGPTERVVYQRASASYHSFARDTLVHTFLGDWLLMLDTDHTFEPDLALRLVKLFEEHDLDVLTGAYVSKTPPHIPILYTLDDTGAVRILANWDPPTDSGPYLLPIAAAGGGCLLVRRRVFDRMRTDLNESPFSIRGAFSEDHSFFDRCRTLGIKTYCCPAIESHHLRTVPVGLADRALGGLPLSPRQEVS